MNARNVPFVFEAVGQALRTATPQIWNTDQGSQFTSPQLTTQLAAAGVQISMDGKGRALDNIFTERLWRSVKYEEVYLADYGSPREARQGTGSLFHVLQHRAAAPGARLSSPGRSAIIGKGGGRHQPIFSARAGHSSPGRGCCAPPAPSAPVSSVSTG